MELTAQNVQEVFFDCMFRDEELTLLEKGQIPESAILVEGVVSKVGFESNRIKQNTPAIKDMLLNLPDAFFHDKGGGFTFLGAAEDKEGRHWGEHRSIEQLMQLGIAAKLIRYCLPREVWGALPGGMPYFTIKLDGFND